MGEFCSCWFYCFACGFLAENRVIALVTNSSLSTQLGWMDTHFNSTCHDSKACTEKH
ncbi:hypothetical protein MANES_14G111801v8 [Manihot esculenta]|uniref:Uncharacterized protein n=1 Tax=Manihot esculenta TaxID=3983 RepID=A0ACB7GHP9_MANES|nr:hypothetical protein MANES_14G111801v8 [Manihot esculenta]